ncbi:hypothetical protein [Streptomyces sp. NBRC 109706]|uniref:hypothetical protein n=1 Tax=Streptomyces sp. NBRC 109706 TaxID=1550035 RepID=UPI000B328BFF|nr:hypothetical protein [Streptomyces sp. NBRC 109706]
MPGPCARKLLPATVVPLPEEEPATAPQARSRPHLGPNFADLSRAYISSRLPLDLLHLPIGHIGSTEVPDAGARTQHEVDVLALYSLNRF